MTTIGMAGRVERVAAMVLALILACAVSAARGGGGVEQPAAARPSAEGSASRANAALEMPDLIRRYTADRASVRDFYDLPWSEARFDRVERLIGEWEGRLAGADFAALDVDGRIDWLLLRDHLAGERQRLTLQRAQLAEMDPVLPFRRAVQGLETQRWAMEEIDPEKSAGMLMEIRDSIKSVRGRVEAGKKAGEKDAGAKDPEKPGDKGAGEPLAVSATVARRAASAAGSLRAALRTWYDFHAGYRPEFAWWARKPYEEAGAALEDYTKLLREEIAGLKGKDEDPLVGDPIGREALLAELRLEVMPYSPEELVSVAEKELAWCTAEMERAAGEMGLEKDWKTALERVKASHVRPGEQDNLVTAQAREAIAFLKDRDLITIPPLAEETWRITMLSPEGQKVLPFAAYNDQSMLVAYPTDAMSHADKLMSMRGNNRHFTRIVTAHELIPGHHLQLFMAERERAYRRAFSTPFFVEGWALYWEMTLYDKRYATTPEDRVGMLFWRMHRCARIIVSLRFHLGTMTPKEMIDFLVERVGHERFGATSEVRRYIAGDYGPLYQVSYMMGGLQLRALRRELVDSGKIGEKAFHDALLRQGAIPIEYIRAALTGAALERDHAASWKFVP